MLPEKKRNKILNQKTRDAKKATDKAEREATKAITKTKREATTATEKEAKKAKKPGNSKVITPPLLLTETSTILPSQNPHKQDAFLAQFLVSRL